MACVDLRFDKMDYFTIRVDMQMMINDDSNDIRVENRKEKKKKKQETNVPSSLITFHFQKLEKSDSGEM